MIPPWTGQIGHVDAKVTIFNQFLVVRLTLQGGRDVNHSHVLVLFSVNLVSVWAFILSPVILIA